MHKQSSFLLALLATASTISWASSAVAAPAAAPPAGAAKATDNLDCYKIEQQSFAQGKHTALAGKAGLRIDCPSRGYTIICKPPDWRMYWFNRKTGRVFERDKNTWVRGTAINVLNLLNDRVNAMQVVGIKPTTFLKQDAVQLKMLQVRERKAEKGEIISEREFGKYILSDKYQLPPEILTAFARLYELPLVDRKYGLPLRFEFTNMRVDKSWELNTLSIDKTTFKPGDLDVPRGLTQVKSQAEILTDPNEHGLEDMFRSRL
jgi:hypothetical protein